MDVQKNNPTLSDFRASRIYAQGWNAARAASLGKAALNPYTPGPEHARWDQGFAEAAGKAQ